MAIGALEAMQLFALKGKAPKDVTLNELSLIGKILGVDVLPDESLRLALISSLESQGIATLGDVVSNSAAQLAVKQLISNAVSSNKRLNLVVAPGDVLPVRCKRDGCNHVNYLDLYEVAEGKS